MLTGGTPRTTGVFYDDTYTRDMWAAGTGCKGPAGTETQYAENLDQTDASGNIPLFTSIDPSQLPLGMLSRTCAPVFPHQFLRTNTIFNIARAAGLYTAWSDKHPAYEIVNGPSGEGVNDLFTPEINTANDPTTQGVAQTAAYDQLKGAGDPERDPWQALRWHRGGSGTGHLRHELPGGQRRSEARGSHQIVPAQPDQHVRSGLCSGRLYAGDAGIHTPAGAGPGVRGRGAWLDGRRIARGRLAQSTALIISAKHGQSPIDPAKLAKIGDQVTSVLTAAGIQVAQDTTDDVALVWLKDQHQSTAAVGALQADKAGANTARIDFIVAGAGLAERFGNPLSNSRTPDLIVQPIPGTIYTRSQAKVAEHGGFADDDTHVALLVVDGSRRVDRARDDAQDRRVSAPVRTTQIAPTIVAFLGLDPSALESVRSERTRVLPL
jgi:hypothetical protein